MAKKLYYSIGEVCGMTGLEAHVLRFWEGEFPQLAPRKNARGTRQYREEDIRLIRRIDELVHKEKYTLDGARRRLRAGDKGLDRATLLEELHGLLKLIDDSGRSAVR